MTRRLAHAFSLLLVAGGCGDQLYLGDDILWSADHETSDLSQWEAHGDGGHELIGTGASFELTGELVRSGERALRLQSNLGDPPATVRLWRAGELPHEAYYSGWFFVPEQYWTTTNWPILKFVSSSADDARIEGIDLQLRSLPGGGYVLVAFDHNRRFLQAPLPDPPALVLPGRWAHLCVFLRQANDDTGELGVWLDGARVYQLEHRPTRLGDHLRFEIVAGAALVEAPALELYVDDVAISLSRVSPSARWRSD